MRRYTMRDRRLADDRKQISLQRQILLTSDQGREPTTMEFPRPSLHVRTSTGSGSLHRPSSFIYNPTAHHDFSRSRTQSMISNFSIGSTGSSWKPFPTPGLKLPEWEKQDDEKWYSTEETRLRETKESDGDDINKARKHWKRWGPYLSERSWGTVREDYSSDGNAWTHFPHEVARSRVFRWGEDGIAGYSDNHQRVAFSLAMWNGKDRMLKERLFGVGNHEGNHGEDCKELYYYLDSTPTHSYMKYLYKYPQEEYPYEKLVQENQRRGRDVNEYEILDTDVFDDDKYWDVFVEYAKDTEDPNATSIRITAFNRGPEPRSLHLIPQLTFRNTWSWQSPRPSQMPTMTQTSSIDDYSSTATVTLDHSTDSKEDPDLGRFYFHVNESPGPTGPPLPRGKAHWTGSKGFRMDEMSPLSDDDESVIDDVVVPELLFTENESNYKRLYGGNNVTPFVKDAFHDHIVPKHRPEEYKIQNPELDIIVDGLMNGKGKRKTNHENGSYKEEETDNEESGLDTPKFGSFIDNRFSSLSPLRPVVSNDSTTTAGYSFRSNDSSRSSRYDPDSYPPPSHLPPFVNPEKRGTKVGAHYVFHDVPAGGGCAVVRLKITPKTLIEDPSIQDEELFDENMDRRREEADEFYSRFEGCGGLNADLGNVMRQALAGMLWSKQFYYLTHKEWQEGDPGQPPPPPTRKWIRNHDWKHFYAKDILSMPDKWEYPFFAAWDSAFHTIPLAMVDPDFAKKQLDLLTREWYMKPDGAIPAYEWNFGDVNPPVHAWATFRVFKIERKMHGVEDLYFLERVFQKLLLNFTWWVNRKDASGANIFEGGFLGLDNIGLFNRSEPLPTGGSLKQADGTGWMAFFCLNMLNIALELAKKNKAYEDIASKFFEHFLFISDALTFNRSEDGREESLWNEEDGFYYDAITWGPNATQQIPVRSLVGLIPLFATLTLEPNAIKMFKGFSGRMDWFVQHRRDLVSRNISDIDSLGRFERRLLALVDEHRLRKILTRMLNEDEFLSPYGIRSLSLEHKDKPYSMTVNNQEFSVNYWPGDSHSPMFGGNSNWRGPIWLATTFLLIESLQRFYQYYGDDFKMECPTGSGVEMNLAQIADDIQKRVIKIFARDENGRRAYNGENDRLNHDPHFKDHINFFEYFHADNAKGIGASHQTGWTGLVAWMIWQSGRNVPMPQTPKSSAAHFFDEHLPPTPGASEYAESMFGYAPSECADLDPDEL